MLLAFLQFGLFALQLLLLLLALLQLFAPAAQVLAQLCMGGILLLQMNHFGLLSLQIMGIQLCFL